MSYNISFYFSVIIKANPGGHQPCGLERKKGLEGSGVGHDPGGKSCEPPKEINCKKSFDGKRWRRQKFPRTLDASQPGRALPDLPRHVMPYL
jgi:hypothetical protein